MKFLNVETRDPESNENPGKVKVEIPEWVKVEIPEWEWSIYVQ